MFYEGHYKFAGFYTTKATGGTQVIDASGNFTDAAKTQVSTSGGTATWYSRWTEDPNGISVTYQCPSTNNTMNINNFLTIIIILFLKQLCLMTKGF